ncbi:MAG: hypothetical protein ABSF26_27135, partial [Thermoguttaceae bacterium]
LYEGISWFFLMQREKGFARIRVSRYQTRGKGHGREETRTYFHTYTTMRDWTRRAARLAECRSWVA